MRKYTKEDVQPLLDKFMDGLTTLEEEDVLANYFRQPDVPQEWRDYQQLFAELEAMKQQTDAPQTAAIHPAAPQHALSAARLRLHRLRWTAAAAVVGLLFTAMLWKTTPDNPAPGEGLTAQTTQSDTSDVLRPEPPNQEPVPDTTAVRRLQERQEKRIPQRRLRKPEPTMLDYDKAYAVMARMEQERQQVEQQMLQVHQQMEQVQQNIIHVKLTAAGYAAIEEEDGTIIYIDEPKDYFVYEE